MNARKVAAWSLGIAAVVVAAGALGLRALVDPDRFKAMALEHARSSWERDLLIGDVSLTLFPVPAFEATQVSFSNPPWCADPHLLQADHVRADLELLPLLTGKVRVKSLELEGVRAKLEEGEDGRGSWELPASDAKAAKGATEAPMNVEAIIVRNLTLHHRGRGGAAEPWHIEEARVDAGPGYRDVHIEARLSRHGQPLHAVARVADLSRAGVEGATSEGRLELRWASTQATVEGKVPLHRSLKGGVLRARAKSASLQDVLAFFGIERKATAPVELRFDARDAGGRLQVTGLAASLGSLVLRGEANVSFRDAKPVVAARLEAGRVDWLRTLADAGGVVKPKRQDGEVFHEDPVAWRVVETLGALDGSTANLKVANLRLGNGLELRDVATRIEMGGGRLQVGPFSAALLGGGAKGTLRLDGNRKTIHAKLDGEKLMLEQWFRQRGSKVPFSGGPMRLEADVTLAGATYRDLAASLTGPVRLHMGKGSWNSKRAGEYEEMMVSALAAKESDEIEFECAAADLDFKAGRARGERLLGARSNVSQLVTGGTIDLREERIDLRGQVRAASGPSVGLAMFAGDVQIHGRLARPKVRLDPDAKPAIIARAAAAIASSGVTLLGGALVDAAEAKKDPCRAVLR